MIARCILFLAVLALGCTEPTELLVRFDASDAVKARAQSLQIVWMGIDGEPQSRTRTIGGPAPEATWPATMPLTPANGSVDEVMVEGRAFDVDSRIVAVVRARTRFVRGERREIWLHFDEECLGGDRCVWEQTCIAGNCEDACFEATAIGEVGRSAPVPCQPSMDAGVDSSMDASPDADGGGDADAGSPVLLPSNVGERLDIESGTVDLTVGGSEPVLVVDTESGELRRWRGTVIDTTGDLEEPNPQRCVQRTMASDVEVSEVGLTMLTQSGGAELAVLALRSLEVEPGAYLIATGSRPLVLLVATSAVIDGVVAAGADWLCDAPGPGPGGGVGGDSMTEVGAGAGGGGVGIGDHCVDGICAGRDFVSMETIACGPGCNDGCSTADGGGGGGSFGEAGGRGGALRTDATRGGAPGDVYPDTDAELLVPLVGGSGGGWASRFLCNDGSNGGHGGGALQISTAEEIAVAGMIDARGGGGAASVKNLAGGGGGSGGAILLEAPSVSISGALGANGGAGGAPGGTTDMDIGRSGPPGGTDAFGVVNPTRTEGSSGGSGSDIDGIGGDGGDENGNAGGGGGGGGRIRINTESGIPDLTGAEWSILPRLASGLTSYGRVQWAPGSSGMAP